MTKSARLLSPETVVAAGARRSLQMDLRHVIGLVGEYLVLAAVAVMVLGAVISVFRP